MKATKTKSIFCLALFGITSVCSAQQDSANEFSFSHSNEKKPTSLYKSVQPGALITVTISDTCKNGFRLLYQGVTIDDKKVKTDSGKRCEEEPIKESWVHQAGYSGYVLRLAYENGVSAGNPETLYGTSATKLEEKLFYINTEKPRGWDLEFSGGFTVSDLTSPEYNLETVTMGEGDNQSSSTLIRRDRDAESSFSKGFAGFAHITIPDGYVLPSWFIPFSFGLGINEQQNLSYYAGPSVRMGELFLTLGVHFGETDRLPNGESVGRATSNENVLSNLSSKSETGAFLSISYSFLGTNTKSLFSGVIAQAPEVTDTSSNTGGGDGGGGDGGDAVSRGGGGLNESDL